MNRSYKVCGDIHVGVLICPCVSHTVDAFSHDDHLSVWSTCYAVRLLFFVKGAKSVQKNKKAVPMLTRSLMISTFWCHLNTQEVPTQPIIVSLLQQVIGHFLGVQKGPGIGDQPLNGSERGSASFFTQSAPLKK